MCKTILIYFQFFLIILHLKTCVSQITRFGPCAKVETKRYFEIEKFLGKWHEIERFPTWFEDEGHCGAKVIQACGRRVEIEHSFVKNGIEYILHINSSYTAGDEAVFAIQENNIDPAGISLSVIETDYQNYAVVYGCKYNEKFNFKYLLAWILSREKTLHEEYWRTACDVINTIPYASTVYLENVDQSDAKCESYWTAHVHAVNISDSDEVVRDYATQKQHFSSETTRSGKY